MGLRAESREEGPFAAVMSWLREEEGLSPARAPPSGMKKGDRESERKRERAAVHACAPFRERKKVEKKSQTGEREIEPLSQPRGRSHASALGLFHSCTTFCVHYFALFFIFTCTRRGGPFFLNAMTVQHCGDRKSKSQDVRRVKAFSTISLSLSLSLSLSAVFVLFNE